MDAGAARRGERGRKGTLTCGSVLVSGGRVRRGLGSERGTRGFAGLRVWAERAGLRGERV